MVNRLYFVAWAACLLVFMPQGRALAAGSCPESNWLNSNQAPSCPGGDNTILPGNYPSAAYVLSGARGPDVPSAANFAETVVLEILKNSTRTPLILMSLSNNECIEVRNAVEVFIAKNPSYAPKKDEWLRALIRTGNSPYPWQQDYFESFYDPRTGRPVLRGVGGYRQGSAEDHYWSRPLLGARIDQILKSGQNVCPDSIQIGPLLEPAKPLARDTGANSGGNTEGLPGGLCLHGDNQSKKFASQYCGSMNNQVEVSTSWLEVGHVDEIVGVVHRPSSPPPCDFALSLASPRLALDLMKKNPNEKFFSISTNGGYSGPDLKKRFLPGSPLGDACTWVEQYRASRDSESPSAPLQKKKRAEKGRKVAFLHKLVDGLIEKSHASLSEESIQNRFSFCSGLTNGMIAEAIEGTERLRVLQEIVQVEMNKTRQIIEARIKERLPRCEVPFVEVPQLFMGAVPVEKRGARGLKGGNVTDRYSLPKRMALSLLPNSANALSVEGTVLTPHPQNQTFLKAIKDGYAKVGVKASFVDTYGAHENAGNLHCLTHALPICKPEGK